MVALPVKELVLPDNGLVLFVACAVSMQIPTPIFYLYGLMTLAYHTYRYGRECGRKAPGKVAWEDKLP
ncbi:MAG: hypothetical protein ACK4ZN_11510 [Oceanibaculum sp.]